MPDLLFKELIFAAIALQTFKCLIHFFSTFIKLCKWDIDKLLEACDSVNCLFD